MSTNLTPQDQELRQEFEQGGLDLNQLAKQNGIGPALGRRERRKKKRWLEKQLAIHMHKKPDINFDVHQEETEEQQEKNVAKMKAWATRYGILVKKIDDLKNGKAA